MKLCSPFTLAFFKENNHIFKVKELKLDQRSRLGLSNSGIHYMSGACELCEEFFLNRQFLSHHVPCYTPDPLCPSQIPFFTFILPHHHSSLCNSFLDFKTTHTHLYLYIQANIHTVGLWRIHRWMRTCDFCSSEISQRLKNTSKITS